MTSWRLPESFSSLPALRPARALLTPTWLLALAVLALNDHLLKGSGLLPGAVTGKLSDFAGMIVAPALFAALVGVRSRRGLLLCHIAVGAVFAAINLAPAAADAWAWLMGLVYPWHITVDPTDLVALPALALGWRALVPAMARPLPRLAHPRLAEAAAVSVGAAFCVATSDNEPPPSDDGGEWGEVGESSSATDPTSDIDYADIQADVYLHNGSDRDISLRTRQLRSDVLLDCAAVTDDPGLLLAEVLFAEGVTYAMPPSTNAPARDINVSADCYAVRVEGDALADPFILFWAADQVSVLTIDGDIDDPALHSPGAVLLTADADGRLSVAEARTPVVFAIDLLPPADAFRPGPDIDRLAWSDPPFGEHALLDVSIGPDGCAAVQVADESARWYVCAPEGAFPFQTGEWVSVEDRFGAVGIRRIPDPMTQEPVALAELTLASGINLPQLDQLVLAAKPDYTRDIAPELACGTVARPNEVSARYEGGEVHTLLPGESVTLEGQGTTVTLWVTHAEDRVVLDPICAEGPDFLGPDLELAALRVENAP